MKNKLSVLAILVTAISAQAFSAQKIQETHPFPELVFASPAPGATAHDILWIIDNSGSMDNYQASVMAQSPNFFKNLELLQGWQSAIATTDSTFFGFDLTGGTIRSGTSQPSVAFAKLVSLLGTMGSGTEAPFQSISDAVLKQSAFFGKFHHLDVILVTDAMEQSSMLTAQALVDQLTLSMSIKPTDISFYPLVAAKDLGCTSTEGDWNFAGSKYEELLKLTSGKAYPLCDASFAGLTEISESIAKDVGVLSSPLPKQVELKLNNQPNFLTLSVSYNGKPLKMGRPANMSGNWYYDYRTNSVVVFELEKFVTAGIKEIEINYEM